MAIVMVMLSTVVVAVWTHNLAIGVIVGVLVAMIAFARRVAHMVTVERTVEEHLGERIAKYTISGELFFASSNDLCTMFDDAGDPQHVVIDFYDSHLWDASTVAALDSVTDQYAHYGKDVEIVGLDQAGRRMRVRLGGMLSNGGHQEHRSRCRTPFRRGPAPVPSPPPATDPDRHRPP